MPGTVRPVADERDGLLAYLAQQRACLKSTVHGLTEEQARLKPISSSGLTLGGLIKHAAIGERGWIAGIVANRLTRDQERARNWATEFELQEGESLAWALELYDEVARETEAIIAGIPDLGQPVPVPQGVPWFPQDVDAWSVRWVLLHLIEELARHGGHADILREAIDGSTFYQLLAASEGWELPTWTLPDA
ncbi:MAG: DinB family protein [Chloroflexota bacterium]